MSGLYHPGELAIQHRMGQAETAAQAVGMVHADIPPRAATFLAEQPMVVIAAADDSGRIWVSPLIGRPGFARADNPGTVNIEALPVSDDPLAEALRRGSCRVGLLIVQPQRRRRMRVNGIARPTGDGICVHVEQAYSNCARYISRRHIEQIVENHGDRRPGPVRRSAVLDGRQRQAIGTTDTLFVGSADEQGNADASHRGGNPGFIEVLAPDRLRWPDYHGNAMFGTLGNIYTNPECGLLVFDWQTGTALQLNGRAKIIWDEANSTPEAQCWIEFAITEVIENDSISPLRWGAAELSPANPTVPSTIWTPS